MFTFTNRLFTESGFYKIISDEINKYRTHGPFDIMYDDKGETVYGYMSGSDQGYDPNYDEYKDSRLTVYDDDKKTVDKNLGEKMLEKHLKNDLLQLLQEDFEKLQLFISSKLNNTKEISQIISAAIQEISYFKEEFKRNDKLKNRLYIFDKIIEIENWINKKYGQLIVTEMPQLENHLQKKIINKKIIWNDELATLCSLFKDLHKNILNAKDEHYITATTDQLIDFITNNFENKSGEPFARDTIKRYLNPTSGKDAKRSKVDLTEILKDNKGIVPKSE